MTRHIHVIHCPLGPNLTLGRGTHAQATAVGNEQVSVPCPSSGRQHRPQDRKRSIFSSVPSTQERVESGGRARDRLSTERRTAAHDAPGFGQHGKDAAWAVSLAVSVRSNQNIFNRAQGRGGVRVAAFPPARRQRLCRGPEHVESVTEQSSTLEHEFPWECRWFCGAPW